MASRLSSDLGIRAEAIYQHRLKSRLESTNPDDFVAIEPEFGGFFSWQDAQRGNSGGAAAYPGRLPFALRVGHKSTVELGATAP